MWLDGKRVVVLGGTSGIGRAVAEAAVEAGAAVVVASSSPERVEQARRWLPAGGEAEQVDLASEEAISAFFGRIGSFDHLVYTAGEPLLIGTLAELDLSAVRRFFEIRFWGAYAAVRHAAPLLNEGGSITLSSGTASQRPGPGQSAIASALRSDLEEASYSRKVELG